MHILCSLFNSLPRFLQYVCCPSQDILLFTLPSFTIQKYIALIPTSKLHNKLTALLLCVLTNFTMLKAFTSYSCFPGSLYARSFVLFPLPSFTTDKTFSCWFHFPGSLYWKLLAVMSVSLFHQIQNVNFLFTSPTVSIQDFSYSYFSYFSDMFTCPLHFSVSLYFYHHFSPKF